jgi:imidazolonepropionase-like amidohydrolase
MTRTVFVGGSVFDGTGSQPWPADVTVEDGRIVDVGSGLDGDDAVDAAGRTILPGLFDCHVHVVLGTIDTWQIVNQPFSYRFYLAARHLRATLEAGITSVRDAGGADLGVKEAVANGVISGPRMQVSLMMLSQTGGHGDDWHISGADIPLLPSYPGMPAGLVDGPDEMRRKVRELRRAGADVVKVAAAVRGPEDVRALARVLVEPAPIGRIVIGMGEAALATRVLFPALGSLVTYAHAGRATAPGQLPLDELVALLRRLGLRA